jgi:hypothetical protein
LRCVEFGVVLGVARMAVGRVVDYTLPSVWRKVEMGGWNGMERRVERGRVKMGGICIHGMDIDFFFLLFLLLLAMIHEFPRLSFSPPARLHCTHPSPCVHTYTQHDRVRGRVGHIMHIMCGMML